MYIIYWVFDLIQICITPVNRANYYRVHSDIPMYGKLYVSVCECVVRAGASPWW